MPNDAVSYHYCIINPHGGPLTVRFRATNVLNTGGAFAIYDSAEQRLESWRMSAGLNGYSDHEIKTVANDLDGGFLTWKLLVCTSSPIDYGDVEIHLLQDGTTCPTTKAAQWSLTNLPRCRKTPGKLTGIPISGTRKFRFR